MARSKFFNRETLPVIFGIAVTGLVVGTAVEATKYLSRNFNGICSEETSPSKPPSFLKFVLCNNSYVDPNEDRTLSP